jgi:hypothetical protein
MVQLGRPGLASGFHSGLLALALGMVSPWLPPQLPLMAGPLTAQHRQRQAERAEWAQLAAEDARILGRAGQACDFDRVALQGLSLVEAAGGDPLVNTDLISVQRNVAVCQERNL